MTTNGVFTSNVESIPAVSATGDNGANGVDAGSDSGTGVSVFCVGGTGVFAQSVRGIGVSAQSDSDSPGVFAQNRGNGIGVHAVGGGASPTTPPSGTQAAIFAEGGPGTGVLATSNSGISVHAVGRGLSPGTTPGPQPAIFAESGGIGGTCIQATCINTCNGVSTFTAEGIGVSAISQNGHGVIGQSRAGGTGVAGSSSKGIGVSGDGGKTGVVAASIEGVALQVIGKVEVQGNSVGSVTMAAGTKTLTVHNAAATANSLILLTPLGNPQAFLWIGARSAGSFKIDASEALPTSVPIMFLIIN